MKDKVKNNREEYITRASLHHSRDGQDQNAECAELETAKSERYLHAVIEEDWYVNFKADDKEL